MPGAAGGEGDIGFAGHGQTMPDAIVQSLMNYRMQAPLVDELMTELGFKSGESPNNLLHSLSQGIADDQEKKYRQQEPSRGCLDRQEFSARERR